MKADTGGFGDAPVIGLVSLGCAKNTVDSERLLAGFVRDGYLLAEDPQVADVCLVNTCGFIGEARAETAAVLDELAARRRRDGRPLLVALGCLVERAAQRPELAGFLARADARFGFADYPRLPALCRALIAGGPRPPPPAATPRKALRLDPAFHREPRLLTGAPHAAALKIAEGCSHRCRFCAIPAIRGPQVSRPMEEILDEARDLLASGVREISLIAQDTTGYGTDRYGRARLADLLRALRGLPGDAWLRLMYAHPRGLDGEVLDALAADPRICPYLDLPLQHATDRMLRAMGRGMDRAATIAVLDRVRRRWPEAELRTAFIVGFPGETEDDFAALLRFAGEGRFLYAGVFGYSPEAGTPAARRTDPVPARATAERRRRLAAALRSSARRRLRRYVGAELPVLVDRPARSGEGPAGAGWVARTRFQAPEVDGVTWLPEGRGLRPGRFARARIGAVRGVDLVAADARPA